MGHNPTYEENVDTIVKIITESVDIPDQCGGCSCGLKVGDQQLMCQHEDLPRWKRVHIDEAPPDDCPKRVKVRAVAHKICVALWP